MQLFCPADLQIFLKKNFMVTSSFFSASSSVDPTPGFSSVMSLTVSRPAVGPLEVKLMLLAWFGNLTPLKKKKKKLKS